MSAWRAAGGASALYGAGLIIRSAARALSRSLGAVMAEALLTTVWLGPVLRLVVGVLERGLPVFVERADPLDPVGMDRRAPVRIHHDRDRLLDRLSLTEV